MGADTLDRVKQIIIGLRLSSQAGTQQKDKEDVFRTLVPIYHDLGRKRLLTKEFTQRDQQAYNLVSLLLGARQYPSKRTVDDKYVDPPQNTFLKQPLPARTAVFLKHMRQALRSKLTPKDQDTSFEQTVLDLAAHRSRAQWLKMVNEQMCHTCRHEVMADVFCALARACVIVSNQHLSLLRSTKKISPVDLDDICTSLSQDLAFVRAACRRVATSGQRKWLDEIEELFLCLVRIINVITIKLPLAKQRAPSSFGTKI